MNTINRAGKRAGTMRRGDRLWLLGVSLLGVLLLGACREEGPEPEAPPPPLQVTVGGRSLVLDSIQARYSPAHEQFRLRAWPADSVRPRLELRHAGPLRTGSASLGGLDWVLLYQADTGDGQQQIASTGQLQLSRVNDTLLWGAFSATLRKCANNRGNTSAEQGRLDSLRYRRVDTALWPHDGLRGLKNCGPFALSRTEVRYFPEAERTVIWARPKMQSYPALSFTLALQPGQTGQFPLDSTGFSANYYPDRERNFAFEGGRIAITRYDTLAPGVSGHFEGPATQVGGGGAFRFAFGRLGRVPFAE
jgi:hypothetical protein